jgi:magnesium transporter
MFQKYHPPVGAQPGSLVAVESALPTRLRVIDYTSERVEELAIDDVAELARFRDSPSVSWIAVQGLRDLDRIRQVGELFAIHPLALEDAVNVPGQPKSELYESNHLVLVRTAAMGAGGSVDYEQVTIFIGKHWVLSFQERYEDVFEQVRRRIRNGAPIRQSAPDFCGYALIDAALDAYFPVLEALGEQLDDLEERVVHHPREELLMEIFRVRRELLTIRRAIWPVRDAVNSLIRDASSFVGAKVRTYLRDCHDHAVQIAEVVESYRELAGSLEGLYMSSVSNRMNQVMQVLTVMASIFIPLTFLAGIWGMNFESMPELHWRYGYPVSLAVMGMIGVALLIWFRARGWLRGRR